MYVPLSIRVRQSRDVTWVAAAKTGALVGYRGSFVEDPSLLD